MQYISVSNRVLIGNPEPLITWKKEGKVLNNQDTRFDVSWCLNTLEIKDALVDDAIEASNSLGTVEGTVTVTVEPTKEPEEEEPVNEAVCVEETTTQETVAEHDDKEEESTEISVIPEIMIKPENITVTPGESVKLSCKIKG